MPTPDIIEVQIPGLQGPAGGDVVVDPDSTMAADSDLVVPSQKATKTALATKITGPASAVDSTPMVADGTTGKLVKNITYAAFKSLLSLVKGDVGLGNVDNTADADKPVSTAQQSALDLKAPLASPTFTGTPTVPTAAQGTNTTQAASTAFVRGEVAALVASAPGALDTLDELAAALGDDANFAATVTSALGGKEPTIPAGASNQVLQGDKTWVAKTDLPISTATQAALNALAADKLDISALGSTLAASTAVTSGNLDYLLGFFDDELRKLPIYVLRPSMFEAVGDGVADDTAALNAMIAKARTIIASNRIPVKIDLDGGSYKVTGDGLNMSGLQCWNLEVCNGAINGHTTGKPVFDLVGSRGYVFRNVLVYGDATNTPTLPFLCARGTATADAFCDNNLFDNVTTIGYWSLAAHYAYAQETTTHLHCRYWNYEATASVAIFEGYDSHPQTSVNKTVITGGASHINNVYLNVDFRYQPQPGVDRATITGISKANPAVVTCSGGHPFANGDTIIIAHIEAGMTQINSREAVIANVTATTFEMTGIDSSAYSTYTTGGYAVRRNTQPAIYMNRMKQHRFIGCYVVSYSQDAIEYAFPDSSRLEQCTFDFLQEGAASRSIWRWTGVGTSTINTYSNEFRGYSTHCGGSYFSTDATGAGRIVAYDTTINVPSHTHQPTNMPLVTTGSEGLFVFYGARISWYNRAGVLMGSYGGSSNGSVFAVSDGKTEVWGAFPKSVSTGSFTPTVAATSGTITILGTVTGYAFYLGDMVHVEYSITITTNGTGASAITATLPATAATGAVAVLNGRSIAVGGQQLQGRIASAGTVVTIWTDDNTYPGADGETLVLSGWYRRG